MLGISSAVTGWGACADAAELLFPVLLCSALTATTLLLVSAMLLSQAPQKDAVIVLGEHFQAVFEHVCCIRGLVAALS